MVSGLSKKNVFVLVFVFVVSVVFLVEPCLAPVTVPTNPKPAPEVVSVTVDHKPVWFPPIIYTDPYSGATSEMAPGYWMQEGYIEIKIKNQPFTPYTDKNGNTINIYYCTFYKRPTSDRWYSDYGYGPDTVYQSDSGYTVLTYKYGGQSSIGYIDGDILFRIQSVEGYFDTWNGVYEGEGSEWVEFTVSVPKSENKPSTSTGRPSTSKPSDSSLQNGSQQGLLKYDLVIILVFVCIIAVLVAVIVYQYKQRKTKPVAATVEGVDRELKTEIATLKNQLNTEVNIKKPS